MKMSAPKWLIPAALIVWIFFVLASFFAVQKPFAAENVLAVGRVWLDIVVAGWLMLVGLGLGSWLLQRFMGNDVPLADLIVLGTGLGLGGIGLLVLGVGLIGLLQPLVAYGLTLGLTALVIPQLRQLFQQWRRWKPANLPNRLVTLYLSLITVFALLLAVLPPTDWDGLFYHLTGPKLYLQAGQIMGGIDVPHFNFPSLMEMLFAWAMLLGSDVAAKLLHFGFGVLLAGLVYLITRRLFSQKAAWPAVVVLTSMPMLGTLAGWAYNDLALAFFQLAAVYAIINYQLSISNEQLTSRQSFLRPRSGQTFIIRHLFLMLSGIFVGLAMGLKYTSFVTPVFIVGLMVWQGYKVAGSRVAGGKVVSSKVAGNEAASDGIVDTTSHVPRNTQHAIRNTLISLTTFALAALFVAAPWYLKNWVFTGNPVYPFLSGVFGGQYWDEFRAAWYASAGTGIGWKPSTLLALPWLLTLGVQDANFWDGRTGPLLLLFLPVVVWAAFSRRFKDRPAAYNVLLLYALAHFAFWALGVIWSRSLWQSRLLLPGLVGLTPVIGWVWVNLNRLDLPQFSVSRFVNIAVAITLALTIVDVGLLTLKINPIPYIIGIESRAEHLTRRLGAHYAAMEQINQDLPPDAAIVFLWEPRSYYCHRDCRSDSILDEFPHLVHQHGSAEAIAEAWRDAGVSHVLIHRSGLDFVLSESPEKIDQTVLSALENRYLKEVFDVVGVYQVYTLTKRGL